jgi:TRAP-type C4-dicarboxylate transport system permease small subunit
LHFKVAEHVARKFFNALLDKNGRTYIGVCVCVCVLYVVTYLVFLCVCFRLLF